MERYTEFMFGVPWVMSFFHQDWTLDASAETEAVADQFVEELEPAAVLLVRGDARLLLDGLSPARITVLWEGCAEDAGRFFRSGRVPDGAVWMRQLIEVCDDWLSRRTDTPTLAGADQYEGRDLAARVSASVEELGGVLDGEVAEALTECVHRCTPDLAFRLLLQALLAKSAALSPVYLALSADQYAMLSALGAAFHYGEYVVSDVAFLAEADDGP